MKAWRIRRGKQFAGSVYVPGDKSISHRAVLMGAFANAPLTIQGLGDGQDNVASLHLVERLGVRIEKTTGGVVLTRNHASSAELGIVDCGNSGTTARLGAGLVCSAGMGATLTGDASLSQRPMSRIVHPLRAMGATIHCANDDRLPMTLLPSKLRGMEYVMPIASAQVKSALLLAGLGATGGTRIAETSPTRDHTERMLRALGAPIAQDGPFITVEQWRGIDQPLALHVPGDLSSAMFLLVAGLRCHQGAVSVHGVGLNPTRTGALDALRQSGATIVETVQDTSPAEPVGSLRALSSRLTALHVTGDTMVRAIDEFPILCVAASGADGKSVFRDIDELRKKESDRVRSTMAMLHAFGVEAELDAEALCVHGPAALRAATVDSHGDHRIAMAAAVLALEAPGESTILGVECVSTSFPTFVDSFRALGATVTEIEA